MNPEKKYLVDETTQHLAKSDYVFLTEYTGLTVAETEVLRTELAKEKAEFHVVKNTIFEVALKQEGAEDLGDFLKGQTAMVVGGQNPGAVVKILEKFRKDKSKVSIKGGYMSRRPITADQVSELKEMPTFEEMRAQFLGLLSTPAQELVIVLNAVPKDLLTVLNGVPQNILSVLKQRSLQEN